MQFSNKELLIFDLDGTLIDSVPDLASAINHMLITLGRMPFEEEQIRFWVGNGAQTLVKRALSGDTTINITLDKTLFESALTIFLDYYAENLATNTRPYDQVPQTLKVLKEAGYTLVIVTNKPYDFVQPILQGLDLAQYFEDYLGGDSLATKKPDPLPLLHICEKFKVPTEKALMIGDSKNDILAASSADIESIAVTYGYNYGEDISIYKPDVVVDTFAEILHYIK